MNIFISRLLLLQCSVAMWLRSHPPSEVGKSPSVNLVSGQDSTMHSATLTLVHWGHVPFVNEIYDITTLLKHVCVSGWCSGASSASAKERNVPYSMLRPTYTHDALQKLVSLGALKHLISQNTDGLHRLSGIPRDRLSELHGNAFHERCEKCGTKYEHPYVACTRGVAVAENVCVHCHCSHRTGRICERKVNMHFM